MNMNPTKFKSNVRLKLNFSGGGNQPPRFTLKFKGSIGAIITALLLSTVVILSIRGETVLAAWLFALAVGVDLKTIKK
jgi:hypothetical protein